ncbi:hypothetical protein [Nocardioides limicola]|uniref:hypothetical protein n=1 Tax=Nocardioides limicola TaxID=2803368 RepID=UPI00193AEA01|nr:hypothetical protein [Nocardioides sp. DJM-14]
MENEISSLHTKREEAQARRTREAAALLDSRHDLEGISAMAEHFRDAVRWTA